MGASNLNKMAEEQPQRNDVAKFALEMAKIAEQAERYEDMVAEMKKIVDDGVKGDELSVEERNLISVGYKNMMSVRRTAWRTIQQVEEEEARKNSTPGAAENLAAYKQNIASEVFDLIDQVCANIVKVYTDESSPLKATKEEVLVFFLKMEGDYYRYGAEITADAKREEYKEKAHKSNDKAQTLAGGLKETNPIRLGLALNYSVFYYELCDKKEMASELAQAAFDNAIDQLDSLGEDAYRDSTLIMQLLKDNLSLWNEANEAGA